MNSSPNAPPGASPEDSPAGRTGEFVRLIGQHQRGVHAFILSLVPNWADADELLQETNMRLWEQFSKYQSGTDFGAWARTIAKYQVLSFRKRKAGEQQQFTDAFIEQVSQEDDVFATNHSRDEALRRCIDRLPERHRSLLRSYYAPGAIPREVAVEMARPLQSIRITLFRLRRALRDCIDRQLRAQSQS